MQGVVPVAADDDSNAEGPHPDRRIVGVDKLSEEGSTVSLVHEAIQPSFEAGVSEVTRDE